MRYLIAFLIAVSLVAPAQTTESSLRTTVSEVLLDVAVRDRKGHIIRDLRPDEVQVLENGVPQKIRHFEFFDGHSAIPSASASAPPTGAPAASVPSVAPQVNELRDMSVVSVVIGDMDPRGRKLALETMRRFVKDELQPNTYVGVFTLGLEGLRSVQSYTNDAESISTAVEKAVQIVWTGTPRTGVNREPAYSRPDIVLNNNPNCPVTGTSQVNTTCPTLVLGDLLNTRWVNELHDVYQGSMRSLLPLQTLVQAQAEIPGRKLILLFSAGLQVHSDTHELLQSVISTANRSNVTLYAVDTRGYTYDQSTDLEKSRQMLAAAAQASMQQQLSAVSGGDRSVTATEVMAPQMAESSIHTNTRGNLAELARGTGGALLPDTLDLREPLQRAMQDVHTHYELSYSPSNTEIDGTFRKIEVKVSRPGALVFSRSGYYALPILNGRQVYPFEMATLRALNTKPQLHQFEFHSATLQFRPDPQQTQFAFVFQAPLRDLTMTKEGEWLKVHLCVTALVKNDQGQVVQKISKDIPYKVPASKTPEIQLGVISFTAPFFVVPGRYTVETAAVDRESMKASVSRSVMVVGQPSTLPVSDVALVRRIDALQEPMNELDPLEARGAKVTPELSDVISAGADGQLRLYAVAYPAAPVNVPIEVNIEIWRDGKVVLRTPASAVPPDANGAASILASVPLGRLPAGQYEAQVSFQYKGRTVTKMTAFTLAAGT